MGSNSFLNTEVVTPHILSVKLKNTSTKIVYINVEVGIGFGNHKKKTIIFLWCPEYVP